MLKLSQLWGITQHVFYVLQVNLLKKIFHTHVVVLHWATLTFSEIGHRLETHLKRREAAIDRDILDLLSNGADDDILREEVFTMMSDIANSVTKEFTHPRIAHLFELISDTN